MYLGFQGLRVLARVLPLWVARALGRGVGYLAYGLLGAQRRLTLHHLGYAFGSSLAPAQRRQVAHGVFLNLGQTAMEWLVLPRLSTDYLRRLITSEGTDHLRDALSKGRGAIVITAHLGNWELIAPYLRSLGFEGGVLARRLRYPEYESFLTRLRGARGVVTLARGSPKEVAQSLRANQVVGMLPDQDVDSLDGIFVEFFGHPAYTPVGPAALSVMTGAPLVPCFIIREGARFRLVIEPPVPAAEVADRTQALTALTRAWSAVVESYIRRYPDQWVWMHRRWKTRPPAPVSPQPAAVSSPAAHAPGEVHPTRPAVALLMGCLAVIGCLLGAASAGCGRPAQPGGAVQEEATAAPAATPGPDAAEHMSGFTLTGFEPDGTKRWILNGEGARVDGHVVTILRPDAVGYDPDRTAYLTAGAAQVNQTNRHVRMEHDVTIHTSDGLWLTTPVLHWIPDENQMATDAPVRIETDHMLLRGRGLAGRTQLKQATIARDVDLVLNPSDDDRPSGTGPKQVRITCDGPLTFDYEHHIATFDQNVHVQDPSGDLYADRLIAYLDEKTHTIRYAEAMGRVRIQQHQNTALSQRAIYEPAIGKITLAGRPSLLVYPSESDPAVQLPFGGLAPQTAQAGDTSLPAARGRTEATP